MAEYLGTHFHLLREDFVRPLRQAVEALREGAELPREVRMWSNASLCGVTVGQPGGVLFRLRLATEEAEAEELDLAGGKAIINGSLLLLSDDGFRTVRCATVHRREAARQLGDGSVFVSLSDQSEADMKSPRGAAVAADEASKIAPLIGRRYAVLDPGAYWGAYKPVLSALQATGTLNTLPLGDCLMRCENTERAPPYLRHAAPTTRRPSATNLGTLDEAPDAQAGYDIRPILNVSSQKTPFRIVDVRREWPTEGSDTGSSLDNWQLKAAKALLTRRLGLVQGPPGTGGLCAAHRNAHRTWPRHALITAHVPARSP
jgi:hypothetical protein